LDFVFWLFEFVSDFELRISDFLWLLLYSQSQEVQKNGSKSVHFGTFLLKKRTFLQKKCKKVQKSANFYPHF